MEQVGAAILAYLDGDLRAAGQQIVALGLHPAEARPFFLVMLAHCVADAEARPKPHDCWARPTRYGTGSACSGSPGS